MSRGFGGANLRVNRYFLAFCLLGLVFLIWKYRKAQSSSSTPIVNVSKTLPSMVRLREVLSVAIEAAKRGGSEVKRIRLEADIGQKSKGKTHEGADNPVTKGDLLSHIWMYYTIFKSFPGLNIISEELHDDPLLAQKVQYASKQNSEVLSTVTKEVLVPTSDVTVWIDPLDATQEYTENLTEYVTTMVCVAVKGQPVIGVVYKPFTDEMSWGWAGLNFTNPGLKTRFHPTKDSLNKLIVSRSHAGDVKKAALNALGPNITVTPAGGAGYKVLEVISGHQDAYIHTTLIKKWDICPGSAILSALGGTLSTLTGLPIDYSDKEVKNTGGVLASFSSHSILVKKLSGITF